MDQYKYQPLLELRQIRLAHILSGSGPEITCNLRVANLGSELQFEALSYVWGQSTESKTIVVGDKLLPVTDNLYQALLMLRKGVSTQRVVWVDAICVNQADILERNAQVRFMAEIYKGASQVIAWLGEEVASDVFAFSALKQLGEYMSNHMDQIDLFIPFSSELHQYVKAFFVRDITTWDQQSPVWPALRKLLQRPYFLRVWIMQEVSLARRVNYVCGSQIMGGDDLGLAFTLLGTSGCVDEVAGDRGTVLGLSAIMSHARLRYGEVRTLVKLLRISRDTMATDPRDKVFAMLGMSTETNITQFSPDYGRSWEEVYRMVTVFCLEKHRSYDVLSLVYPSWMHSDQSKQPSWTPWLKSTSEISSKIGQPIKPFNSMNRACPFRAAKNTTVAFCFDSDHNVLTCKGILVAVILKAVDSPLVPFEACPEHYFSWKEECDLLARICPDPYVTGETATDAYWQTMVCGMDMNGSQVGSSTRQNYDEWNKVCRSIAEKYGVEYSHAFFKLHQNPFFRETGMRGAGLERVLCITREGYLGQVPVAARPGDFICVFLGGNIPFVLRPEENSATYRLVGEAYLHGFMYGEALSLPDVMIQDFAIR